MCTRALINRAARDRNAWGARNHESTHPANVVREGYTETVGLGWVEKNVLDFNGKREREPDICDLGKSGQLLEKPFPLKPLYHFSSKSNSILNCLQHTPSLLPTNISIPACLCLLFLPELPRLPTFSVSIGGTNNPPGFWAGNPGTYPWLSSLLSTSTLQHSVNSRLLMPSPQCLNLTFSPFPGLLPSYLNLSSAGWSLCLQLPRSLINSPKIPGHDDFIQWLAINSWIKINSSMFKALNEQSFVYFFLVLKIAPSQPLPAPERWLLFSLFFFNLSHISNSFGPLSTNLVAKLPLFHPFVCLFKHLLKHLLCARPRARYQGHRKAMVPAWSSMKTSLSKQSLNDLFLP